MTRLVTDPIPVPVAVDRLLEHVPGDLLGEGARDRQPDGRGVEVTNAVMDHPPGQSRAQRGQRLVVA